MIWTIAVFTRDGGQVQLDDIRHPAVTRANPARAIALVLFVLPVGAVALVLICLRGDAGKYNTYSVFGLGRARDPTRHAKTHGVVGLFAKRGG